MIKKYIIDGNNLIGRMSDLWSLQQKDKQLARVKLVKIIDQYFGGKKFIISLHFDGFPADKIHSSISKITYSQNITADSKIREEIDSEKNSRSVAIISSDHSVQNYAKVNSCRIIKSEEFAGLLNVENKVKSEEDITKSISSDEIKKLFGL